MRLLVFYIGFFVCLMTLQEGYAQQYRISDASGKEMTDVQEEEQDSIEVNIESFSMNKDMGIVDPQEMDTAFHQFQNYNVIYKNDISVTSLGNMGSAYESNDFFKRIKKGEFFFLNSFRNYIKYPEDIRFYNTTVPYTILNYSQSEQQNTKNETTFSFTHTQNVNEDLNFSLNYENRKSTGQFLNQSNKNYNIYLTGNYTADQYRGYFAFISNSLGNEENGGLLKDEDIDSPLDTDELQVRMNNASRTKVHSDGISYSHEYRLGKYVEKETEDMIEDVFIPRLGVQHFVEYTSYKRYYSNDNPNGGFFSDVLTNNSFTGDTTRFKRFYNRFQLNSFEAPDRKYTFGKNAFIENEQITIYQPMMVNNEDAVGNVTKVYGEKKRTYSNNYVGGSIYRREGTFWTWEGNARLCYTGFKKGEFDINFKMEKPFVIGKDTMALQAFTKIQNISPDYFEQEYFSNHFEWDQSLDNQQRFTLGGTLFSKDKTLELGARYALNTKFIYNNENGLPTQGSKEFSIFSAYAKKHFKVGSFNFLAHVRLQQLSDDSYIKLPQVSAYTSTYFYFLWEKVMHTHIGFDTRYFSSYYADTYDPATSRFHLQTEKKIGNFPQIDLFVNLKLKRTRAFFKLINAAEGLIGEDQFTALHYPLNRRTFRLGLSWTFYD
ncbi:hypothetical protein EYV94_26930 [Puteibacter caeruleilacunae]|nr:hypothetical protein EYV94_26930 [Puteibacter caeruleilacunae]